MKNKLWNKIKNMILVFMAATLLLTTGNVASSSELGISVYVLEEIGLGTFFG